MKKQQAQQNLRKTWIKTKVNIILELERILCKLKIIKQSILGAGNHLYINIILIECNNILNLLELTSNHMGNRQAEEQKAIGLSDILFRIEEKHMSSTLHRSIVAITFMRGNKDAAGSGVLISSNLVLTAAHNLFTKNSKRTHDINSFKIFIRANGNVQDYFEVEDWRYLKEHETCSSKRQKKAKFDYALLKLKDHPKLQTDYDQFIELSEPCECMLSKDPELYYDIYGYPLYKDNYAPADKPQGGLQYLLWQFGRSEKNCIVDWNPKIHIIKYRISTYPGHSGSPIVVHNKLIVGIHIIAGGQNEQFNIGRLVTKDMIQNIKKWGKQMNGSQFKVNEECPQKQRKKRQRRQEKNKEREAQALKKEADELRAKCKYEEAFQKYMKSLKLFQQIKGKGSQQTTEILNALGTVYYSQGKQAQALEYYRECLQIEQTIKGKGCIESATILNNIGLIYENQEDYPNAFQYYIECQQIQQKLKGKGCMESAITLSNIGTVYKGYKNYAKALEYYLACLEIEQRVKGEGCIESATTLNNIGAVYEAQKDQQRALQYYFMCLQIQQSVKGKGCIESATTLNNIGTVYYDTGYFFQSLLFQRQAIAIYQTLSVKYKGYANIHQNLGKAYLKLGDYEAATKCFQESQKTFNKLEIKDRAERVAQKIVQCKAFLNRNQNKQRISIGKGLDN